MARWELKEEPEMIQIANEHYDKILDEIAEILYRHACISEGQWLDQNQQNSSVSENDGAKSFKDKVPKTRWRTA